MSNKFYKKVVTIYGIQHFNNANLNRDDMGTPKTTTVNGTVRARVSSQCWKHAIREKMEEKGIRTRLLHDHMKGILLNLGADEKSAEKCANHFTNNITKAKAKEQNETEKCEDIKSISITYLSNQEFEAFANAYKDAGFNPSGIKFADVWKNARLSISSDIKMFGRMFASRPEFNTTAAASFNHPFSINEIKNPEDDYSTALDDLAECGAGNMRTDEYTPASTFYRYATIDLDQLMKNSYKASYSEEDYKDAIDAVKAMLNAFLDSVPAAKAHAYGQFSPVDFVKIRVGDQAFDNVESAFETPVSTIAEGITALNNEYENAKANDDRNWHDDFVGTSTKGVKEKGGTEFTQGQLIDNVVKSLNTIAGL